MSKIDNDLIFTRFGSLTDQRDKLYLDFIEIDEKKEISDAWVHFSGNVVNDLLEVVNLTKRFYDRLIDGIRRSNKAPSKEDLERIKNITEFWLDLSIMSYLYSTIEKRGLFGQDVSDKSINQMGYIETKKSFDELTLLAFQAGAEFFTQDARITLGEKLFLAQEKQRLSYLDELEEGPELIPKILGEYDLKQAHFLISRVKDSLIESANSWWWKDPIAMYSLSQHAVEHISSMNINWSQTTSDLVTRGMEFTSTFYAPTQAFSNLSLAQHYKRLGIAALRQRANSIAADYFKLAVNLTSPLPIENLDMKDNYDFWGSSAHLQWLIYEQMSVLAQISSDYDKVIDALKEKDLNLVKLIVGTNLEKLNHVLNTGDVAYLTSVAVTYETVFSYIEEQIKNKDYKIDEVLNFVEKRIKTVTERLHKATHQLSSNWIRIINKDPDNLDGLEDVVMNLEAPMLALFVLPESNKAVETATREILAIKSATEALLMQEFANEEFGTNPVKEMLMRSKAYKLTEAASQFIADIKADETTELIKKLIMPMKKKSLLRGLIAEIQLKSAVIQFQFVNRIAPLIENSILSNPNMKKPLEIDLEELSAFEKDAAMIELAAKTIVKNQAPIKIRGMPIDFKIFESIAISTQALKNVVTTVKKSIIAMMVDDNSDKALNWGEAKDIAQKTADLLASVQSQEAQQMGEQIFGLTHMYRNYENQARDGNKITDFPVKGIITLLQELVMGI
ncbi:MAG: hypothetical protein INQ03_09955 [Candidatus Heimdallarchaeota archaeon]|nr:hypothetical protein [Candidatus Heimdallarchaeota archaeon]